MITAPHINVRRFKSMRLALGEMQRYWYRDHLRTGPEFDQLNGLRSREIMGNWLIAAALNLDAGWERWSFTSERAGEHGVDGYLYDSTVNGGYPTEHTIALEFGDTPTTTTEDRIIRAITKKQKHGGAQYAKGKILVVMVEGGKQMWHPNAVARRLPPHDFDTIWVVAFQKIVDDHRIYAATNLKFLGQNVPTWLVCISPDFTAWSVKRTQ
jgi:hypothetical protein